jgi:hypothetical protein
MTAPREAAKGTTPGEGVDAFMLLSPVKVDDLYESCNHGLDVDGSFEKS